MSYKKPEGNICGSTVIVCNAGNCNAELQLPLNPMVIHRMIKEAGWKEGKANVGHILHTCPNCTHMKVE